MNLHNIMERVTRVLTVISFVAIVFMMMVVVLNVLGRALFRTPVYGAVEFVQIGGAIMVSFIAGYAQLHKQNVAVGTFVDHFSPRVQDIFNCIAWFFCMAATGVLVWSAYVTAMDMFKAHEITAIYETPQYQYRFVWLLGLIVLGLVFLVDFIESVAKVVKK